MDKTEQGYDFLFEHIELIHMHRKISRIYNIKYGV